MTSEPKTDGSAATASTSAASDTTRASSNPSPRPSLSDRLADLKKLPTARITATGKALGRSIGTGLSGLTARAKTSADLPPASGDLKARVRAGLENLKSEPAVVASAAGIGAKVEALLKPQSAGDELPAAPSPQAKAREDLAAFKSLTPPARTFAETAGSAAKRAATGAAEAARVATVLAERTRTYGRVGYTAVHARLSALQKVRERRAEAKASPPPSPDGKIARIDAELPKRAPLPSKPPTPKRSLWRDRRETAPPTEAVRAAAALQPVEVPIERTSKTQVARRETGRSRLALGFGTLLTALVAGGILHIATTFAIPAWRSGSAFDRLRGTLPINTMKVVGSEQQPSPLPFLSPDMRYAMCRYDISTGPIIIEAILPDVGWSLTLYTPQGDNYYAVPGQDGRITEAAFTLVPASDRLLNLTPGVRKTDVDATQVTSPQREGLIVVRAPHKGAAFQATTLAELAKATCRATTRR